jgi:hypothetical protein
LITNQQHPITPSRDLMDQWHERSEMGEKSYQLFINIFQAGADMELEACCEWLAERSPSAALTATELRAVRRPKPQSLKEKALESVKRFESSGNFYFSEMGDLATIRRALEQLDD